MQVEVKYQPCCKTCDRTEDTDDRITRYSDPVPGVNRFMIWGRGEEHFMSFQCSHL